MFESFILAGGRSKRMKRDKAFVKLGGERTLLEIAVATLEQTATKKISVVIAKHSGKFENFNVITDIYQDRGALGGIQTALASCREKYALIIACDYPFISPELLNYLLAFAEQNEAGCIAPVQPDGRIQPLCAVYQKEVCLEILTKIFETSDKTPSAQEFVKMLTPKLVEFQEISDLPKAENFFFNVNTPEDLKWAEDDRERARKTAK